MIFGSFGHSEHINMLAELVVRTSLLHSDIGFLDNSHIDMLELKTQATQHN